MNRSAPCARPDYGGATAAAEIFWGPAYSQVHGRVLFTQKMDGVAVHAEIHGLPQTPSGFFGFHLHEGVCGDPGVDPNNYFPDSKGHFNPRGTEHPMHAGDFPPLLSDNSSAYLTFMTGRFTVDQILGRAVIIHLHPDNFTTQPSGDSGPKIACGMVKATAGRY